MTGPGTARRVAGLLELGAGLLLVTRARRCWQAVANASPRPSDVLATRGLGGRYLIQGLCRLRWPNRYGRTWAAVDLLHACSMAAVASRASSARRPAIFSAAIATTSGLLQLAAAHVAVGDVAEPAITSQGVPSTAPPTATADSGQQTSSSQSLEATHSFVIAARQQRVIDTVLDEHGGEPAPAVAIALQRGFAQAGLAEPPPSWIDAVAISIANGHRYIVAAQPDRAADESGTPEATARDRSARLWFSNDPKIVHIDPDQAVEHGEEHM